MLQYFLNNNDDFAQINTRNHINNYLYNRPGSASYNTNFYKEDNFNRINYGLNGFNYQNRQPPFNQKQFDYLHN